MTTPADRRYTESHEWIKDEGGGLYALGVTQFAVNELTDITYVQMKNPGAKIAAGGTVGEIESVKATSDIYTPLGGEIVEVNKALSDDPGQVNKDPYGAGWLVKIRVADASPLSDLMDASAYQSAHGS